MTFMRRSKSLKKKVGQKLLIKSEPLNISFKFNTLFSNDMSQDNSFQANLPSLLPEEEKAFQDQGSAVSKSTLMPNSQSTQQHANVKSLIKQSPSDHPKMRFYNSPAKPDLRDLTFSADKIMNEDHFKHHEVFQRAHKRSFSGKENDEDYEDYESEDGSHQLNNQTPSQHNGEDLRNQSHIEESTGSPNQGYQQNIPVTLTTPSKMKRSSQKKKHCKCQRSKCLKMYCECFSAGLKCQACDCCDCHNLEEYEQERTQAILIIKKRNPKAFTPTQTNKCNCAKSHCRKDYCECCLAQRRCGSDCSCQNCQNKPETAMTIKKRGTTQEC